MFVGNKQIETGSETGEGAATGRIRVCLVDDEEDFHQFFSAFMARHPEFEPVAPCMSGRQALEVVPQARPDVVLLDFALGDMEGTECARQLKLLAPQVRLLMLTSHPPRDLVHQSVANGARGYLLKQHMMNHLPEAIKKIHAGGAYLMPEAVDALVDVLNGGALAVPGHLGLTARESEILRLLANGVGRKAVAVQFGLATATVDAHARRIYKKLGVHGLKQAREKLSSSSV